MDFPLTDLVEARTSSGASVSVCIPAHDEQETVGAIVECILRSLVIEHPIVDEVIVFDDRSEDGTATVARRAGANVVDVADVLPEMERPKGKGNVLWSSLFASSGDIVCWVDADIRHFRTEMVTGLLGPLFSSPDLGLVKGCYARPTNGNGAGGGRVTELVARPLIASLFPELARVRQPLAGATAGRREVLEALPFIPGWGVEFGLLVDVARGFGPKAIAQTHLGDLYHRNKPLEKLAPQAEAVVRIALDRSGIRPGRDVIRAQVPGPAGAEVAELPPAREVRRAPMRQSVRSA